MIKTKQKLAAFLVALMMILPMFAFVTMIETKAALRGSGTADDPYQIYTTEDLLSIPTVGMEYNYILMNDLDFRGETIEPIGLTENKPFIGKFDGNYKVIQNYNVKSNAAGLFGWTNGAIIKQLSIKNSTVTGSARGGAVIASAVDTSLYQCAVENIIVQTTTKEYQTGGIIGYMLRGSMEQCYSSGTVVSKGPAGGVIGQADSYVTIKDCYSICEINSTEVFVGGMVGFHVQGEMTNCFASGDLTGKYQIGGLSGHSAGANIHSSVALNSKIELMFNNNYNTIGRITSYGESFESQFKNNLAYDNMVVLTNGLQHNIKDTNPDADSKQGQNTSKADLQTQSIYEALGWDFDNVWYMDGYPKLQFAIEGGTTNPDPDTETVTINDTVTGTDNNQIEYTRNWFHQTQSGNYMNDEHVTNTPDSSFQIRFNGNGIKWYGAFALDRGIAAVYIDDEFVQYVNCYDPTYQPGALLFDSGTMDTGQHTFKVVLIPFKHIEATNHYITVDKIEIESVK